MPWPLWFILGGLALLACAFLARRVLDNPWGDIEGGLLWLLGRVYVRVFHGLNVTGREHLPWSRNPGPMIVIANHTAGIDPMLIQAVCRFPVRWMMAVDMRLPALEWFWNWIRIIDVDRDAGASVTAVRDAMRHLRSGGVLGIFPEGQIARPARRLLPFQAGVGALVQRTGAIVLPVVIDGTPQVQPAWASLWRPSRATVRILPPIDYTGTGLTGEQIVKDLRQRFADWTGWPLVPAREPAPSLPVDEPAPARRRNGGSAGAPAA